MTTTTEQKRGLMIVLRSYQRWIASGKTSHHDNYHENIQQTHDPTVFLFIIQTHDSPDGDTWWYGRFRMIGDVDLELLESWFETDGRGRHDRCRILKT